MLAELRIDNLLLIQSAQVEFSPGLNVFTGETGAGKSLLLDAMGFLLGGRGDAEMVRPGAAQAEVSARFLLHDADLADSFAHELGVVFDEPRAKSEKRSKNAAPDELVLARTIPRTGRARAHANGRPIALTTLRELGERLLDIHGQHENQSLLRAGTRLEILDRFAGAQHERDAVRQRYAGALEAARTLTELRRAARNRQQREELTRFQLKELEEARLDELDPDALEAEARLLRSAEKVRTAAALAQSALDGEDGDSAAVLLSRAAKQFSGLADAGPDAARLAEQLETLLADVQEAARDASALAEKAKSDPERLADLDERRARLRALERRHGHDLEGLRALQQKLRSELGDLQDLDIRTEQREVELAKAIAGLRTACEKLSQKRRSAARELEKKTQHELAELGLKGARLEVRLEPHMAENSETKSTGAISVEQEYAFDDEARKLLPAELRASGAESTEILFSANREIPPRPIKECASGGEISRVMLGLKGVLARVGGADRLPVVVFDEIDSGVGGRLGAMLGRKLSDLSRVRQVLCVTHQPQLAAFGQRQLRVEKERSGNTTAVRVEVLEGQRRIDELAVMLRGEAASAHTREEASAMLQEAQSGSTKNS